MKFSAGEEKRLLFDTAEALEVTTDGARDGLIFPQGMNFDCGSCTRCCRGTWTVHLDPHAWRKVRDSALFERLERENGEAPAYVEDPQAGEASARTRLKGADCVFLGADRLCMIHKELGVTAKPFGCLQFPFLMRPTPDGIYVGVSFYCSAVQANHGRPLAEHVGDLSRAAQTHHFPSIGEVLALDEAHSVPWALYRDIEDDARVALAAAPLREGLWQAAMRILLLSSGVQRGAEAGATWARAREARIERDEIFVSLEQVFLTGTIATIESGDADACKINSAAVFRRGRLTTESFGEVDLGGFDAWRRGFDAEWSHAELRRYLEHLLFRKFLAYKRTLVANAAAWYLTLPLLEWYRDLAAFVRGAAEPTIDDLWRAFTIVERSFNLHARHMDVFFQELALGYRRMLDQMPELLPGGLA